MTITESRLKNGTLTIGTEEDSETFACQASNVRLTPSYDDDGDPLETLCGDQVTAGKKESWALAGTSVQDFDDPDGFLAFCYAHAMTAQPFTWQPNPNGPEWAGSVQVLALEEGGDVNTRLTTDWEFPCNGRPARTIAGKAPAAPIVAGVAPASAAAGATATITGTDLGTPPAADATETTEGDATEGDATEGDDVEASGGEAQPGPGSTAPASGTETPSGGA